MGKSPESNITQVPFVDNKKEKENVCIQCNMLFTACFFVKVGKINGFGNREKLILCKCVSHKLELYAISNLAVCRKIMMFHTSAFYCGFC